MDRMDIIEEIRAGRAYDMVAENYWNMSNEELKDICLEFIYELNCHDRFARYNVADELADRWELYV